MRILQKEDKRLRQKSKEVEASDISSPKIKRIISQMKEALDSQDDGVAIAAPQVGELLRIFVVSGKVETLIRMQKEKNKREKFPDLKDIVKKFPDLVFINPKITKLSREKEMMEEGCLSVRFLYGKVKRHKKVSLEALDEKGKPIKKGASGLLAQIFQHETDHLEGTLFTDKAESLEEIKPVKTTKA
ncbi:MAG: peptide deformylase [Parcubacteria group bacterium Gr01-1014_107]|nr:MAG: peptide deformylase [Parcubacteria group bacterium Gr01-1014_107]